MKVYEGKFLEIFKSICDKTDFPLILLFESLESYHNKFNFFVLKNSDFFWVEIRRIKFNCSGVSIRKIKIGENVSRKTEIGCLPRKTVFSMKIFSLKKTYQFVIQILYLKCLQLVHQNLGSENSTLKNVITIICDAVRFFYYWITNFAFIN